MKLKKLLIVALAGFLFMSGASTAKAADLDLAWYAKQNPDVVKVLGDSPEMLKLHYELCGRKEARMANSHDTEAQLRRLFKAEEYGTLYPDIQKAFGENTEAMFQHYMAFGLLEGRRPSEKVSKATASSLKAAVETAMKDAGLTVAPGSAQLVQIITGEAAAANIGNAAVQQAMMKVTSVVEKAVTNTVQEVTNPTPAPKSSGSSKNEEPTYTEELGENAIWATLADHSSPENTTLTSKLNTLNSSAAIRNSQPDDGTLVRLVAFGADESTKVSIPKHKNTSDATEKVWVGIGVPYYESGRYEYAVGRYTPNDNTEGEMELDFGQKNDSHMEKDGKQYATFYWELKNDGKGGYVIVLDHRDHKSYQYAVDFSNIEEATSENNS